MNATLDIQMKRMGATSPLTNPIEGVVVWSPVKSLWLTGHLLVAIIGGWFTISRGAILLSFALTVLTLCLGHTTGLHRLLVHRSFRCPNWLEYLLVHLGVVVGMGGPFRILYMHDIRDWAQRHPACHPFFTDQSPLWKDCLWQMHCELKLEHPPQFTIEPQVRENGFYQCMQRTWMLQQLPWALLCYGVLGPAGVVWGISVRIVVSLTGHWFIGWLAHNVGQRDWHLRDHAVQGYNLPHAGLITMGEGWHNNHHAYPESARLGLRPGQHDPAWWVISGLRALGLAWDVKEPHHLPDRPERIALHHPDDAKTRCSSFFDLHLL
jgi:stearoyl-CoA desaturase (delta-9 desaturase)